MNEIIQILPYLLFAIFISFSYYLYNKFCKKWDKKINDIIMKIYGGQGYE